MQQTIAHMTLLLFPWAGRVAYVFLPSIMRHPKFCHSTALCPPEYHRGQKVGWPWEENLKSLSCFPCCSTWQGMAYCTLHWELLAHPVASQSPDHQPISLSYPPAARLLVLAAPCHFCLWRTWAIQLNIAAFVLRFFFFNIPFYKPSKPNSDILP